MNNEIPESNGTIFSLGEVSRCDVLQSLKSLRSDCSTVGVPGEKSLGETERTNNKLNPRMPQTPGFEPRPHWWETSAITTAPLVLPNKGEQGEQGVPRSNKREQGVTRGNKGEHGGTWGNKGEHGVTRVKKGKNV